MSYFGKPLLLNTVCCIYKTILCPVAINSFGTQASPVRPAKNIPDGPTDKGNVSCGQNSPCLFLCLDNWMSDLDDHFDMVGMECVCLSGLSAVHIYLLEDQTWTCVENGECKHASVSAFF